MLTPKWLSTLIRSLVCLFAAACSVGLIAFGTFIVIAIRPSGFEWVIFFASGCLPVIAGIMGITGVVYYTGILDDDDIKDILDDNDEPLVIHGQGDYRKELRPSDLRSRAS